MRFPDGVRSLKGQRLATGLRFGIAAAAYYDEIVSSLVSGAVETLVAAGAEASDIVVAECPGAVELPLLVDAMARRTHKDGGAYFDGLLALGCVVRGGTPHFDYVCDMAAQGLGRVSLDRSIPVAFGLLTCDDGEQAHARSGLPTVSSPSKGNKGVEAAIAALEMVSLVRPGGLLWEA